jgi:hypothetical protein
VICTIGFFIPICLLILDFTGSPPQWAAPDSGLVAFLLFVVIVLSYVLGYILRLSSPDKLDRISARYVLKGESTSKYFRQDEWPYSPSDPLDKYPYFNFRNYLIRRGHAHLTKHLVTWGPDEMSMNGKSWPDKGEDGKPIKVTKRSKSTVNKMKIDIRLYCPELTGLLEGKEGHIRLMSGTWAAFRFSRWPVGITSIVLTVLAVLFLLSGPSSYLWKASQNYLLLAFISITMWMIVYFSNRRIEHLFHYRRVNELFHIVQAAYLADEVKQRDATAKANGKKSTR